MRIPSSLQLNFQELCSNIILRQIDSLFTTAGFLPQPESARQVSGQRRTRVEEYYAGINWNSPDDARKFLEVLSLFLSQNYIDEEYKDELRTLCQVAGLVVQGTRVHFSTTVGPDWLFNEDGGLDRAEFSQYCDRIAASVDADPEQAIGSAKELLEAISKFILEKLDQDYEKTASLSQLVKKTMGELRLHVDSIPESAKGAKPIRQVLGSLSAVVQGMAELRNLYGTGHGRVPTKSGVQPRHARLAVGAAITVATFLLDTYDVRDSYRSGESR